jgi:hypothetical protein
MASSDPAKVRSGEGRRHGGGRERLPGAASEHEQHEGEAGTAFVLRGFTERLRAEARQHSFGIKLWEQTDLVQAVYRTYEKLSPEIQAELPLKKVWVLVREGVEKRGHGGLGARRAVLPVSERGADQRARRPPPRATAE